MMKERLAMKFIGTGLAHGKRKVLNDDLAKIMDTSDEWIREKSGIESRWFADGQSNADIACEASLKAIEESGLSARDIDAVIVCTFTADKATPGVATEICGMLGLREDVLATDVNGACSGFIYGAIVANALLHTGSYQNILLVGSETISSFMSMKDRGTDVLFGDGAGAAVCTLREDALFAHLEGVISDSEVLYCERFEQRISMQGQEVYRFAVNKIPEVTQELLDQNGVNKDDVDFFIFHQANKRIIRSIASKLGVPIEKCFMDLEEYGNTSAASVAIAMADMRDKGLLKPGMLAVSVGFGAGLTYGGMLFRA
ncbi:MAG: beta-ketoacyl-ACP synthase 3 [[Eubacterium] sulci]|jgi:3-oxoacyl-[acyl-carrier-protein] synthase III protein 1|nr:beta-ketoacyl-ACP synthase 3 [[Eubacterium] sulci]